MSNTIKQTQLIGKTTIVHHYYDVTDVARGLFGDIVYKAMQEVHITYGMEMDSYSRNEIDRSISNINSDKSKLDLAIGEVIITFTNGKTIKISTSEWGSIENA